MSDTRRRNLLLLAVLVLALLNMWVRLGDDGPVELNFEGITDLETAWTPALRQTMDEVAALPELSFRMRKEAPPEGETRNPFVFGADRVKEAEQQEQLAAMEQARAAEQAQIETQAAAEPEPVRETFDGKLLGVMQNAANGEVKVSVLYMDEYHVLAIGETLDERYRLLSVSPAGVRFLALTSEQEIEIPLDTVQGE